MYQACITMLHMKLVNPICNIKLCSTLKILWLQSGHLFSCSIRFLGQVLVCQVSSLSVVHACHHHQYRRFY